MVINWHRYPLDDFIFIRKRENYIAIWNSLSLSHSLLLHDDQLKCCCSNQGQRPDWSSMPQNMLLKLSSLTMWSIFWHWISALEVVWKSWATPVGLAEDGKRVLLLLCWVDRGLSIAGVLEISNLISELFSLLLLLDPSVSLLRLMDSVGSLLFSANICSSVWQQWNF